VPNNELWAQIDALLRSKDKRGDRLKRSLIERYLISQPCPFCDTEINVYETVDDTYSLDKIYNGDYVCPACKSHLKFIAPFVTDHPGWNWGKGESILSYAERIGLKRI